MKSLGRPAFDRVALRGPITRRRLGSLGRHWSLAFLPFFCLGLAFPAPSGLYAADAVAAADSDQYRWSCTTVDDQTGQPVAGVHVTWEFRRPYPLARGVDPSLWKTQFVSDQHGRYEVAVPKSVVEAAGRSVGIEHHHPQYLPSRDSSWPLRMPAEPAGQGLDHRHIQLERGVKVTGVIVRPDGSPAANVPVMFARSRDGFGDSNGGYWHGFWTRTDSRGRYLFYTRNTWPQRIHWYPDDYEANSRALTQEFGEQETIRLKPGLTMAGSVVDAAGQPLTGIVVQASTGTRVPYLFATSDGRGQFRFPPLPAGSYRLAAVRSYHDTRTGDSLSAALPFPIPARDYVLSDATASAEPRAVLQAAPLIRIPVEVADGDGQPLADATLSIGDTSDFMNAVLAQPIKGQPGRYEFRFPRGQFIRDLQLRRSLDEAAFYQLNREHPPVAAEAIVLGKAQADLPPVRVIVRKAAELTVRAVTAEGETPSGRIQIDASYGADTESRIQAAERANREPSANFMAPRIIHLQPAGRPWNPTFQQLVPGEPIVVSVRSDAYTAEAVTVTLQEGEHRSLELRIRKTTD